MNIKKQYNQLFKTLSRLFGVRRAKRLLQKLIDTKTEPRNNHDLMSAFVWSTATEKSYYRKSAKFWAKANRNAKKRIKGY